MDEAPKTPFERVGRGKYGYNTRQVDEFVSRVRNRYATNDSSGTSSAPPRAGSPDGGSRRAGSHRAGPRGSGELTSRDVRSVAFDAARGGYDPHAVDLALDRFEDIFAQQERRQAEAEGDSERLLAAARGTALIAGRLHRPAGERFRRPTRRRVPSYNVEDVDALCDRLLRHFDDGAALSVDIPRSAVFREAKGAEGYEEAQVDAFLDRVVEVMTARA